MIWDTLSSDEQPGDVLWSGDLEPTNPDIVEQVVRNLRVRLVSCSRDELYDRAREVITDFSAASIGIPSVWPLQTMYSADKIPPKMMGLLKAHDYYVVKLDCSLRPKRGETKIEWARFDVALIADGDGNQPLVFDLDPQAVTQDVQRSRKITISPSVTFKEIELSVGGVEWGSEYTELRPVITSDGSGERQAGWDYRADKGFWLQGGYRMHLIAQAPKGMPKGRAVLQLKAHVVRDGVRFWVGPKKGKDQDRTIPVTLWGEG